MVGGGPASTDSQNDLTWLPSRVDADNHQWGEPEQVVMVIRTVRPFKEPLKIPPARAATIIHCDYEFSLHGEYLVIL